MSVYARYCSIQVSIAVRLDIDCSSRVEGYRDMNSKCHFGRNLDTLCRSYQQGGGLFLGREISLLIVLLVFCLDLEQEGGGLNCFQLHLQLNFEFGGKGYVQAVLV